MYTDVKSMTLLFNEIDIDFIIKKKLPLGYTFVTERRAMTLLENGPRSL